MTASLHIDVFGEGNTIVLLHGWGMHSGVLRGFAQQLARQARVVCVDLPGHGLSPLQQPFALPHIVEQVLPIIDDTPCYWLGWSLGGLVALAVAQQAPQRVRGVILLAGTPYFVKQADWPGLEIAALDDIARDLAVDLKGTALRFLALQVQGLPRASQLLKALKLSLEEQPSPSLAVLQAGLAILKQQDLRAALAALNCPVLALLGARDTLVPIAVATHLQRLSAHLQLSILDDAGHVLFLSHPEVTAQRVLDFINADSTGSLPVAALTPSLATGGTGSLPVAALTPSLAIA